MLQQALTFVARSEKNINFMKRNIQMLHKRKYKVMSPRINKKEKNVIELMKHLCA